ncbi:MAG: alpha/beta fold hydrolase [Cypionkella sp.]
MKPQTLQESDGTTLAWIEAGPETASGEPLLLIHGVGMRAEAWGPQIETLSTHLRVIALDMPGHGGTSALPAGALLPDYVAWAERAMQALGLRSANVAGHSMGALIALGLAASRPYLVLRVALLNAVHRRTTEARAAVVARAEAIAAGAFDLENPLQRWFLPGEDAVRAQVSGWLSDVDRDGYAAAYHAFALGDATYADQLGRVSCPALMLTGAADPNSTAEMAHAMADAAPRGRAVVIEGHRHMVNLTAPDAVSQALSDWLAIPLHTLQEKRA